MQCKSSWVLRKWTWFRLKWLMWGELLYFWTFHVKRIHILFVGLLRFTETDRFLEGIGQFLVGLALNSFQLLKLECGFNGFLHKRLVERWIILGIVRESAPGTWYQENFSFLLRPLLSVCLSVCRIREMVSEGKWFSVVLCCWHFQRRKHFQQFLLKADWGARAKEPFSAVIVQDVETHLPAENVSFHLTIWTQICREWGGAENFCP